jgi:hypothetical protein
MPTVTINRVRVGVERARLTRNSWSYRGFLVTPPEIGRFLVIHNTADEEQLVTSVVRRVLSARQGRVVYVETDNSVYRLAFVDDQTVPEPNREGFHDVTSGARKHGAE